MIPEQLVNDDEIKNVVIEGYRNILKREPDTGSLANYIDEIKNGLTIEKFYSVLRSLEEYRQKFSIQNMSSVFEKKSSIITSSTIMITYCMMGLNSLHEIRPYVETILSYIDRFIFIDGGSNDGTVEYLQSINTDNKIDIYIREWRDNFPDQRNNYLRHFAEKQNNGWILVSDTDEHFPIDTLSKLRDIIKIAEYEGYNGIRILAYDIIIDDNNPNKILSEHVSNSNFHKPLLFKYHKDIFYEGGVHETLKGPIVWKEVDLIYQHMYKK